jgi:hypothetical protein
MRRVLLLLLAALLHAYVEPQQSSAPGSIVSGGVVGIDGRTGVAGTIVTLTRQDAVIRSTVSGQDGAFRIDSLEPGRYRITVTKPAHHFVSDQGAAELDLQAGENVEGVRLRVLRGASISGVVSDEKQQPIAAMHISVFRLDADGAVVQVHRPLVSSDDLGQFRFYGLPAGEYLVAAVPPNAALAGEIGMPTTTEVDRVLAELQNGRRRFDDTPAESAQVTRRTGGLFPVYHPGVFDPALATRLRVNYGDDLAGVDIRMAGNTNAITVIGQVIGSPADLATAALTMTQDGADFVSSSYARIRPGADGTFVLRGVPPGTYTIHARTADYAWWARSTFRAEGTDVSGLNLVLEKTMTIRGQIVPAADPVANLAALRVIPLNASEAAVRRRTLQGLGAGLLPPAAAVAQDGSFVLTGLAAGAHRFQLVGLPARVKIERVMRAGKDLPDGELILRSADTIADRMQIVIGR